MRPGTHVNIVADIGPHGSVKLGRAIIVKPSNGRGTHQDIRYEGTGREERVPTHWCKPFIGEPVPLAIHRGSLQAA